MFNKKLILISSLTALLLSGCASVMNDINNALTGGSNNSEPEVSTVLKTNYKLNTYMRYTYIKSFTLNDHIKTWGKPDQEYSLGSNYIAKWKPFSDKNCEVYINFDAKTKRAKPLEYLLDGCENIVVTGPKMEVPANEVYFAGYLETRKVVRGDYMEKWIGQNVDKALVSWGSPFSSVPLNSGGRIYTWKDYWETRRNVWSGEYTYGYCERTFVTDPKGTITNWNYKNCNSVNGGDMPKLIPVPKPR